MAIINLSDVNIDSIIDIAIKAGFAILEEYDTLAPQYDTKADKSPLTRADLRAHTIIKTELEKIFPGIPVLSEEGKEIPYEERMNWEYFWCVDPMDGTKEFLKKTGQFTVNIALIKRDRPVLGVIHVPAESVTYYAKEEEGSFRRKGKRVKRIETRELDSMNIVLVASKDHAGAMVANLVERFPDAKRLSMGSSLKFCLVAEGKADVYLRDVPTYEWDTAAAHAIIKEAGGYLGTLSGAMLVYNKPSLLNPPLLTTGDQADFWREHVLS
ncbi:MAG: 3'(2'), 5'-bisphosphate nucleotidase CysQ [Bacteroidetes bacterium HLUCCA01]|nr:MAG: 3'(2'), 5'-bisphosphate nucleotidase CysQ [Bacteroidetes bacterium HLUCCA01]